jgi:hypothetical protein
MTTLMVLSGNTSIHKTNVSPSILNSGSVLTAPFLLGVGSCVTCTATLALMWVVIPCMLVVPPPWPRLASLLISSSSWVDGLLTHSRSTYVNIRHCLLLFFLPMSHDWATSYWCVSHHLSSSFPVCNNTFSSFPIFPYHFPYHFFILSYSSFTVLQIQFFSDPADFRAGS